MVVNKPAGLVCHPTKGDAYSSLIGRLRLHLGPERPAHLINRLDRETSGLVMVAKRDEPALLLRRIWEARKVRKEYLAAVHGHVSGASGVIEASLGKDVSSAIAIKDCVRSDGASARTDFEVEDRFTRGSLPFSRLRVMPQTGRKHQIRIHLAHIGHPIVGDKLYGGDEDLYLALAQNRLTEEQRRRLILPNQALHARELSFDWHGQECVFRAEPEKSLSDFLSLADS